MVTNVGSTVPGLNLEFVSVHKPMLSAITSMQTPLQHTHSSALIGDEKYRQVRCPLGGIVNVTRKPDWLNVALQMRRTEIFHRITEKHGTLSSGWLVRQTMHSSANILFHTGKFTQTILCKRYAQKHKQRGRKKNEEIEERSVKEQGKEKKRGEGERRNARPFVITRSQFW